MSLDVVEPRTTADIVRDLLARVEAGEWVEMYNRCSKGCCGEWSTECPSCGAHEGDYDDPNAYRQHKEGCRLKALIVEAEAFLAVEEELNGR